MKTTPITLKEKTIYSNRLLVFRNTHTSTPTATNLWLVLPSYPGSDEPNPYDGKTATFYDWKADFDAGTIAARGEIYMGNGRYEKFDGTFRCSKEEVALTKPGRNFEWNDFFGEWRNPKTGEKRKAF